MHSTARDQVGSLYAGRSGCRGHSMQGLSGTEPTKGEHRLAAEVGRQQLQVHTCTERMVMTSYTLQTDAKSRTCLCVGSFRRDTRPHSLEHGAVQAAILGFHCSGLAMSSTCTHGTHMISLRHMLDMMSMVSTLIAPLLWQLLREAGASHTPSTVISHYILYRGYLAACLFVEHF